MMNGIDVSSHQTGINLEVVPCDFVIVKATEGTSYVNPDCNRAFQQGLALDKKMGLYHFASGTDPIAEADYFVNNIRNYIGKAILVLDWEADAVTKGVSWAKKWLDRVYEQTGVKPLLYSYNNCINSYDWTSVANADYGLWNAGYFAGYTPMSYDPLAPLKGGTGAWKNAAIYQYTSSGRLPGWSGNLDLNVAYMDKQAWDKYAGNTKTSATNSIGYIVQVGHFADNRIGEAKALGNKLMSMGHKDSTSIRKDKEGYVVQVGVFEEDRLGEAKALGNWLMANGHKNSTSIKTIKM